MKKRENVTPRSQDEAIARRQTLTDDGRLRLPATESNKRHARTTAPRGWYAGILEAIARNEVGLWVHHDERYPAMNEIETHCRISIEPDQRE
jgi:hypothetical protein